MKRYAKYEMLLHAINRNSDYGIPVEVLAESRQQAIARGIAIGWGGSPGDAQVTLRRITDMPVTCDCEVAE